MIVRSVFFVAIEGRILEPRGPMAYAHKRQRTPEDRGWGRHWGRFLHGTVPECRSFPLRVTAAWFALLRGFSARRDLGYESPGRWFIETCPSPTPRPRPQQQQGRFLTVLSCAAALLKLMILLQVSWGTDQTSLMFVGHRAGFALVCVVVFGTR